jgi:uncharacterized protein DUF4384
MISALLLPLLIAGGPAPAQPAATPHDDPPIQLWISNDRRFYPGERAKVQVRTEDDGYLIVFHVEPEGYLRVLFPLDPEKDNFVRGGKKYEVRGRGGREAFEADGKGRGTVYAAVSRDPFRLDGFVLGDHWDYRALAPSRLSSNPEAELNELVRRMAQGNFDYDLLTYEVVERVVYASDYSSRYYGSVYDDPWCYRFSCGHSYYGSPSSLSIGLFFGRPYRRYYYDPYFYVYDPFYNPFFYDPYYYGRIYYPRYYHRPYYYDSYRDRYRYDDWYRGQNRPYTPYRFRGADGFSPGYRDRNVVRQAVNTVYNPPIFPIREPAVSTPARRVVQSPEDELPNRAAPRRVVDDARRVLNRPIEAHRARPAEQEPSRSSGEPRLVRREVEARPAREATPARDEGERRREQPRAVERPREEPRQIERTREEPRRVERAREEPRQVERPAPESRPSRRETERSAAPAPERGGGRSEGRSSGGGVSSGGGSRPDEGGRRRR